MDKKPDTISFKQAVKEPRMWAFVYAGEPDRKINVSMTYKELFALVKLFDRYREERKGKEKGLY